MSSLPIPNISKRSDRGVQLFFDTYYTKDINFSDNDLNAIIAFFESRGFDNSAAIAVSTSLLSQAKAQKIPVFKLIDTLKTYTGIQLSSIVAEILNFNRRRTSAIGFKREKNKLTIESRNIIEGNNQPTFSEVAPGLNLSSTEITLDSEEITLDGE
jgi:hypothetical protein